MAPLGAATLSTDTEKFASTDFIELDRNPLSVDLWAGLGKLIDLIAIFASGVVVHLLLLGIRGGVLQHEIFAVSFLAGVLIVLTSMRSKYYRPDNFLSAQIFAKDTLVSWSMTFAIILGIAFALKISAEFSRIWATTWFLVGGVGLVGARAMFKLKTAKLFQRGRFATRAVIYGADERGEKLAGLLANSRENAVHFIGFADERDGRFELQKSSIPYIGNLEDLVRMVRDNQVDQVYVALPWTAIDRINDVIKAISEMPISIRLLPNPNTAILPHTGLSMVAGLPTLHLFDRPLSDWSNFQKRAEDLILAAIAMLFSAPLLALIAIVIKLDSKGPVIFRQPRHGFNDRVFTAYKFRTMYVDQTCVGAETQTSRGDPRVTRVGRWLRKTSLDELPQLFNVLQGNMSLVGPRPHPLRMLAGGIELKDAVEKYAARHRVLPGITGWAQVNGLRGEASSIEKINKRVEFDLHYIDNWSLWLDCKIICKTVLLVWVDRNAY